MRVPILKQFEESQIRISIDEQDNPWFIALDVMKALGIKHQASALKKLKNSQRGSSTMHTPGGMQELTSVSESGLYSLIFLSRKPNALKFQEWITAEVIPSIRKTGTYTVPTDQKSSALQQLRMLVSAMEEAENKVIQFGSQLLEVQNEQANMKFDIAKAEEQGDDTLTATQISELDRVIANRSYVVGDIRHAGMIKRAIKEACFLIRSTRTYKEIKRSQFPLALQIASQYVPASGFKFTERKRK